MTNRKLIQGRLNKIATYAEEYCLANGNNKIPIDPFYIAKNADITIVGDSFNREFDGRSECISGKFVIFYDNTLGDQHPRTRFTIAHELAHCEIAEHRKYLLSGGQPHNCKVEFMSEEQPEIEADTFAAALILPEDSFSNVLNEIEPSFDHFINLSKKFNTSITCTLLRGIDLGEYPFSIIKIKNKKVSWAFHTKSMMENNLSFIKTGTNIPNSCNLNKKYFYDTNIIKGHIYAFEWFENFNKKISLWEEIIQIESCNDQLLLLTFQDYNDWK